MPDKLGKDIGSDGRTDGDTQAARHFLALLGHQLADALRLLTDTPGLPDALLTHERWPDTLVRPVEEPHIQFFLQLRKHGAQCGLRHTQYLGSLGEIAMTVDGEDIFQLL